jgi:hypothetical protein
MRSLLALTLAVLGLSGPAGAQDRPNMIPTRDVAIIYRATAEGGVPPVEVWMSWLSARRLLRTDTPGVAWSVADHANGTGFIVMEEARRVMDMPPVVIRHQLGPTPEARFTREGTDRVAGHGCTTWRYEDTGSEGRVCLTADGVMLRTRGTMSGITGGMEAIRVTYAAQDAARFELPEGYQHIQPRQRPAR